jgi:IclR family mhp operon transcriptional activator
MCGGYHVTGKAAELTAGCSGISRVLEVARPLAIGLTRQIKWPIGLGEIDCDEIAIRYWTGTISPFVHTNTILGTRGDLYNSAMGRAYMAFCSDDRREYYIRGLRQRLPGFDDSEEAAFRVLLEGVRRAGYAARAPRTGPTARTTTLGVPILTEGNIAAVMSVTYFTSSVPPHVLTKSVLDPLVETRLNIEHALEIISAGPGVNASAEYGYEVNR